MKQASSQSLTSRWFYLSLLLFVVTAHSTAPKSASAKVQKRTEKTDSHAFFYHGKHLVTEVRSRKQANKEIVIRDSAKNTLWVGKRSQIKDIFATILPRELDRLFAPVHRHHRAGNYRMALSLLAELALLFPGNPYVRHQIGLQHLALGERKLAAEAFELASQKAANDFDSQTELGNLRFQDGTFNKAIDSYKKALQAVNKHLKPFKVVKPQIPEHFSKQQPFNEYVDTLEDRKRTLQQNLVLAYRRLADDLYYQNNQTGALKALSNAMKLLPDHPGLMETYRIYSVFPPTPPKKEEEDFEIWQQEIQKQVKNGRIDRALRIIGHLKPLYPKESRLVELASTIVLKEAEKLSGIRKLNFLIGAVERDKRQTKVSSLLAKLLVETAEQTKNGERLFDVVLLSERFHTAQSSKTSGGVLAQTYLHFAQHLRGKNYLDDAREWSEKGLELDPNNKQLAQLNSQVHVELGKVYSQQGDLDASIESYQKAVDSGEATLWIRLLLAGLKLRRFVEQYFQLILLIVLGALIIGLVLNRASNRLLQKKAAKKYRLAGWKAYQNKSWDIAIDNLTKYIKQTRGAIQFPIYQALAESYKHVENHEAALLTYRKINYLFPQSACHVDAAKLYVDMGRTTLLLSTIKSSPNLQDDAQTLIDYCFNKIEEDHSDARLLQEMVGGLYMILGDVERAKYIFLQVITSYKKQENVRYSFRKLIEINKRASDLDGTLKLLKQYEKAYPDDPIVYFELGQWYEVSGDIEAALLNYKKSNKLNYSEVLEEKIRSFQRASHEKRLAEELKKMGGKPNTPSERLRIIKLHYQIGKYDECIRECNNLIAEGQLIYESMRMLGLTYYHTEEYSRSAECLQNYIKNAGEDPTSEKIKEARYRLARAYMKQHLIELAIREFNDLHSVDPEYRDVKEKIHLSVTTCPYCDRQLSTQETICPHCKMRLRYEGADASKFMIGSNQYHEDDRYSEEVSQVAPEPEAKSEDK